MEPYTLEQVTQLRKFRKGDQIAVLCTTEAIPYYHFGIYLGAENGVAEFGKYLPRIVDLLDFKGESTLYRAVYPPGQCLDPEVVVQRAWDVVEKRFIWGAYRLLTNNCEHFATYCKTGKAFSRQVGDNTFLGRTAIGVIAMAIEPSNSISGVFGSSSSSF